MFWFFFLFPPQEPFCIFVIVSFSFPLSPSHFFSFLHSTPGIVSPLEFLFFPLFWYNLDCISGRPHLSAIIHAGQIAYMLENTHTHAQPPPPLSNVTQPPRPSHGSQMSPLLDCPPIQHLCSETRTISILHKEPYLELSHRHVLYMCLGTYRTRFQCVYVYTLLELKIYSLKKKISQSWLCVAFIMTSVIWIILASKVIYTKSLVMAAIGLTYVEINFEVTR